MTQTEPVTSYQFGPEHGPEQEFAPAEPSGWSPLAVALIATLVLLLGLGGALFGIYVANTNAAAGTSVPTSPPSGPTPTPTSSTPAPTTPPVTTTPPATTNPPPADTFALPELAGMDFQAARKAVRDLKLGWRLVFEDGGKDASVRTTEPAGGTMVKKGTTIKIFVKGAAPPATVPGVMGLPCAQAAGIVVEQGLYPKYPTGNEGTVVNQVPSSSDPQTLRWNDEVQLFCA